MRLAPKNEVVRTEVPGPSLERAEEMVDIFFPEIKALSLVKQEEIKLQCD